VPVHAEVDHWQPEMAAQVVEVVREVHTAGVPEHTSVSVS
jgi:hypothetical protein